MRRALPDTILMRATNPADRDAPTTWRRAAVPVLLLCLTVALLRLPPLLRPSPTTDTKATAASDLRFPCLSYAPFRQPGTSPNDPSLIIPAAQIARDLAQVATVSDCVRLYGTANGLDAAPAIARKLGLRVWLGAWIGSDVQLNHAETERALALAQEHADIVDRLIVGSETLLRGELTPEALAALLADARKRSPVPVAYADVWEFWLQHGELLRPQVDEAVIHILPYWENQPVPVERALDHLNQTYAQVRTALAPLPVVIGETGWPAAGRAREAARPGSDEQAFFLHALLRQQHEQPLPLNVIEAYDQPWKASLEGVAGAAWGIFRADGGQRFGATGTHSTAVQTAIAALAGAVLMLLASGITTARDTGTGIGWPLATAFAGGALLGVLAAPALAELALLSTDTRAWQSRAAALAGAMLWALLEMQALARAMAAAPSSSLLPIVRTLGLLATILYALLLVTDGRYLDLAWPLLAAPAVPFVLQRWLQPRADVPSRRQQVLAGALVAGGAAVAVVEGWRNGAALSVVLLMLVLAACCLWRTPPSIN